MTVPQHIYQIHIRATPQQVWKAITEPEFTTHYFHRTAIETSLEPGSGFRYLLPDGEPAVEGVVEEVEPGRRMVLTWRILYDADLAAEPPGRVEWLLHPANDDGSVTKVQVRHYDLGLSPGTWADVKDGWHAVIDGLKTLLETGQPLGPVEASTIVESDQVERQWHRAQAVKANNSTWDLLGPTAGEDDPSMSADEAFDLLARAYAAAYHWRLVNGPVSINAARAAWLCSRAHAVVGDGVAALRLAELCRETTLGAAADAADFDHLYAAEAKARALACLGRWDEASQAYGEAERHLAAIADGDDLAIAAADLAAGPWFGLRRPEAV